MEQRQEVLENFAGPTPAANAAEDQVHDPGYQLLPPVDHPLISVIIPAHNEEEYIQRTLISLMDQSYRNFEVLVIANGCTDGTVPAAEGLCHQLINRQQRGLGAARNLGASLARGDLLIFLDADTALDPNALEVVTRRFTRACAAGTLKGRPDKRRFIYQLIYFAKNFFHRTRMHPGSSGVMLCWKEHFEKVGGFDCSLNIRENSELNRRLKNFGSYSYLGQAAATTSMRRYENGGIRRTLWLWLRLWFQSQRGDLHNRSYEVVR